jgi:hypothetical protein
VPLVGILVLRILAERLRGDDERDGRPPRVAAPVARAFEG